jgi:2-oxoglutarate dehydrogenase E2 component (dihydrolipoamide succinyltransferase)
MKKVGDKVERDEPLFEISTDKVDSEVPAPTSGVLEKIYVEEGATVAINTKVARIGDGSGKDDDDEPEPAKADAKEESSPAKATAKEEPARDRGAEAKAEKAEKTEKKASPEPSANGDRIRSSPLVRKLAKENDIDLRHRTRTARAKEKPSIASSWRTSSGEFECRQRGPLSSALPLDSTSAAPRSRSSHWPKAATSSIDCVCRRRRATTRRRSTPWQAW